jgi:hypothetical protein
MRAPIPINSPSKQSISELELASYLLNEIEKVEALGVQKSPGLQSGLYNSTTNQAQSKQRRYDSERHDEILPRAP